MGSDADGLGRDIPAADRDLGCRVRCGGGRVRDVDLAGFAGKKRDVVVAEVGRQDARVVRCIEECELRGQGRGGAGVFQLDVNARGLIGAGCSGGGGEAYGRRWLSWRYVGLSAASQ